MTLELLAWLGIAGAVPLYDLAADVAARRDEASQELGRRAAVETVEDVFVLVTPAGAGGGPGIGTLDQQGKLWPFYQRYRDQYESDPTGQVAFEAVVGKSLAEANDDWARWVKRL